jgi:chromatin remodeling complex protein RSC6
MCAVLLAGKPAAGYKSSEFFERIKVAHQEEEEDRTKRVEKEKERRAAAAASGEPEKEKEAGAGQNKRKRGDTKSKKGKKDEELDEATLLRKTIVRRYKKNSLPKNITGKMVRVSPDVIGHTVKVTHMRLVCVDSWVAWTWTASRTCCASPCETS